MSYPKLQQSGGTRQLIDAFAGYNHKLKISDGEWYDTENLTTQHFPLFANRGKRGVISGISGLGTVTPFTKLQGIIAKGSLCWVDNGTMYVNGAATGLTGLQTTKETQLVSMGAYVCVFPDKKYINTAKLTDYGDMGAAWTYEGSVTYSMCHADGTIYTSVTESASAPENPDGGDIWVDPTDDTVREYSVYSEEWVILETVYTRLDFQTMGQVPAAFQEMDGVNVSGCYNEDLNGSKIIYALGGSGSETDWIVLVGIQGESVTQSDAQISVSRKVPDMDFVCEAQNRLWGCFYGNDGTQNINEIYCCALGDFRNWEQYLGVSTDSWRASRGSDGPWTGCVNYLGSPTFFKENVIHPISVSSQGAHQIDDLPARGVQKGSHKSLAIVNETLYYKARTGIVAYQGGMPADVSQALGDELYYEAAAGVFGQRYYVSMRNADNEWNLFCYDAQKGIWVREDSLHAGMFTTLGDEIYAMVGNTIVALNGTEGVKEDHVDWGAVSGIMHYDQRVSGRGSVNVRYVSHYNLRLSMAKDAMMRMYIEYDSSGVWTPAGEVRVKDTGIVTLPVRPRRCDHLRIKLEGRGDVRIYSIARVLAKGSDA